MTTDSRSPSPTRGDASLVRETLRTMGILVAACVIFVGVLSVIAVAVTSRAVGGTSPSAEAKESPAAVKKPLSI